MCLQFNVQVLASKQKRWSPPQPEWIIVGPHWFFFFWSFPHWRPPLGLHQRSCHQARLARRSLKRDNPFSTTPGNSRQRLHSTPRYSIGTPMGGSPGSRGCLGYSGVRLGHGGLCLSLRLEVTPKTLGSLRTVIKFRVVPEFNVLAPIGRAHTDCHPWDLVALQGPRPDLTLLLFYILAIYVFLWLMP